MKKIFKILLIAIPLLLIAVLAILYFSINSIVKGAIETHMPPMTRTAVTVQSVNLSPFSASGSMSGWVIGNPQGYGTEYAFKLKEIKIDLELMSVFSDTVVVEEVFVDSPDIIYEGGLSGSNIGTIQGNIENYNKSGAAPEPKKNAEPGSKKLIINRLTIKNPVLRLGVTPLHGNVVTLRLPDIEIKDIGRKSGGDTAARVASQILAPLVESILRAAADPNKFLQQNMGSLEGSIKKIGEDVKQVPSKVLDDLFKKK